MFPYKMASEKYTFSWDQVILLDIFFDYFSFYYCSSL